MALISDDGMQFTSKLSVALYERLGTSKINTSSYYPCTNGGVERVNHVLAQMLSCLLYTSPSPRDATLSRMPSSA